MTKARKMKIGLTVILVTFSIGVSAWLLYNSPYFETTKLEIPNSNWEKIFFKPIDKTTELAKLQKLRDKNLSFNDIEIRIWEGFGLEDLEGVIFTRTDNIWRAFYIKANNNFEPTKADYTQLFNVPQSGWKSFTRQLFNTNILTLPDADSIDCQMYNLDGRRYVMEIYKEKTYRTYSYADNADEKCEEGKQINKIAKLIAEEFHNGSQICNELEWLSCNNEEE